MDRPIVYPASIPLDTDLLVAGQTSKEALGRLLDCVYGQQVSSAYGFAANPSSSAMTVTFGAGIVNAWGEVDVTSIGGQGGGLAANGNGVTNQYLAEQPQTLTLSQTGVTYTVYAQCVESDTDNVVLPFYNAANPTQTQAGPSNNGQGLPTRRVASVTLVAATSAPNPPTNGTQVALYTIVVPSGATAASQCSFAELAPFYLTLPEIQTLLQKQAPGRLLRIDVITSSGTSQWTPPVGASTFRIRMVGGGGSGGYAAQCTGSSETSAGGAGGAGAYMEFLMSSVNMGAVTYNGTVSVVIGAGGVANEEQVSGAGAATMFGALSASSSPNYLANCGGGGGGCYGGATANSTSSVAAQGFGGTASIGNQNLIQTLAVMAGGATGFSGMCFNGANWPGVGVNSPMGAGGGNTSSGQGGPGQGYGSSGAGGGSGSGQSTGYMGGNGAPGCVVIKSYS